MKCILLFVLVSCTVTFGQKSWNIIGSMGLIELRTDNPMVKQNGTFINGWKVDLNSRIYLNRLYLNPGLDFSYIDQEGSKDIEIFKNYPANSFFNLPLLVGCDIIRNDEFKLRAFAGPSLSYLFRIDKNNFGNNKNTYHPLTAGLNIGLGVDFYPLVFDFQYELGLNNYYKIPGYKANKYLFTLGFILDK